MKKTPPAMLRARRLYARLGAPGGLPRWPAAKLQKKYTGTSGVPLMRSTLRFVDTLARDGAFAKPGWRGLDYGCGWGRIASVLPTGGDATRLDLCDAWPRTIELLQRAGFANRILAVSELMADDELPKDAYDLIYAYSVFTHLRRDAFETNLAVLRSALRRGGNLYLTVRHADYMTRIAATEADLRDLHRDGFWYRPSENSVYFGTAVVTPDHVAGLFPDGSAEYLGEVDACQHLYAIRSR